MKRLRLGMGLRWQLVLLFLLVSLIPLLIVALLAHGAGTRRLRDTIQKNLISEAQERLDYADYMIDDVITDRLPTRLRNIGRRLASTYDDNRLSTLKSAHEGLLNSIPQLERRIGENGGIIITNRHQQVIYATDEKLLFQEINEQWWHTAYNNGIGYGLLGNVEYDFETQQYSLPVTIPIMGPQPESKVVGVLRVVALLPKFSEVINSKEEGQEICLFDQYGRVICASPDSGHQFSERIEMTNAAGMQLMRAMSITDPTWKGKPMREEKKGSMDGLAQQNGEIRKRVSSKTLPIREGGASTLGIRISPVGGCWYRYLPHWLSRE